MEIKPRHLEGHGGRKAKRIRCVENGREWNSIKDMCIEFGLKLESVNTGIYSRGFYGGYHFEFLK